MLLKASGAWVPGCHYYSYWYEVKWCRGFRRVGPNSVLTFVAWTSNQGRPLQGHRPAARLRAPPRLGARPAQVAHEVVRSCAVDVGQRQALGAADRSGPGALGAVAATPGPGRELVSYTILYYTILYYTIL